MVSVVVLNVTCLGVLVPYKQCTVAITTHALLLFKQWSVQNKLVRLEEKGTTDLLFGALTFLRTLGILFW